MDPIQYHFFAFILVAVSQGSIIANGEQVSSDIVRRIGRNGDPGFEITKDHYKDNYNAGIEAILLNPLLKLFKFSWENRSYGDNGRYGKDGENGNSDYRGAKEIGESQFESYGRHGENGANGRNGESRGHLMFLNGANEEIGGKVGNGDNGRDSIFENGGNGGAGENGGHGGHSIFGNGGTGGAGEKGGNGGNSIFGNGGSGGYGVYGGNGGHSLFGSGGSGGNGTVILVRENGRHSMFKNEGNGENRENGRIEGYAGGSTFGSRWAERDLGNGDMEKSVEKDDSVLEG